jgi:hypothetical protein
MFARLSNRVAGLLCASLVSAVCVASAGAASFSWNVVAGGGNWSGANWNGGVSGPTTPGNTATINNNTPSAWSGTQTVIVDTPIDIDQLTFTDNAPPAGQIMIFRVSQDSTIQTINWFNDVAGDGRSRYQIDGGRTLSVNNLQFTGRFPDPNIGNGTLKFIGASASFGYFGGTEQYGSGHTVDFSTPVTMNVNRNGGSAELEGRDNTWVVGNASSNQTWNVTGGQLVLDLRAVGGGWNFHKVGANDVNMSGVTIQRAITGDHGSVQQRNLFTTAAGAATAGGEVRIGGYYWIEQSNFNANNDLQFEKVGSNLTIANGGNMLIQGRNAAGDNDVSMMWVMSGKTLKIEGAGTGNLTIDDSASPLSAGRMGVYFDGATLDVDRNLSLLGPNTFLNGGTVGGTINVGGNAIVQSQNATGFSTITSLVAGHSAASDDFDLRKSTITFDGGGARSLNYAVNATHLGLSNPVLTAGDFSLANFTLGTLHVTNNTNLTLSVDQVLYLSQDLVIDAGSTLTLTGNLSELHILDADLSEFSRINGYLGTRLFAGDLGFLVTPGVGYSLGILPIPEPSTAALLLGGLVFFTRRRRVGK